MKNGLIRLIRMAESTRHIWVKATHLCYPHKLNEPILSFKGCQDYFVLIFVSEIRVFIEKSIKTLIRWSILWHLIQVYPVCQDAFSGTLGIKGLLYNLIERQQLNFQLKSIAQLDVLLFELQHDKTNKMTCAPSEIQISLGIRPVWSESSLSAWRKLQFLATHWAHSKDSDQTGQMPRLIRIFAGCKGHFAGFVMLWLICLFEIQFLVKQRINRNLWALFHCSPLCSLQINPFRQESQRV